MSIDPRIALGTSIPTAPRSPFQTLGALTELRQRQQLNDERQLAIDAQRSAVEDDYAVRATLARTGNPDAAIEELYRSGRPGAAGALGKQIYEWRKTKAEQIKLETANAQDKLKLATQIAQGITDQGSFDMGKRAINALLTPVLGQDITEQFGTEYDPERVKQLQAWGTERIQFLKQQQDAIDNANKAIELGMKMNADIDQRAKLRQDADAYWTKAASGYLSTARSQEQWDAFQSMLFKGGASPATLARFGNEYSPEAVDRAKKLAMSPKDVEDLRHQKVTDSQGQQNINLRQRELERREAETEAPRKGLTPNRQSEIEEWRARQFSELEKSLRDPDNGFIDPATGRLAIPDDIKPEIAHRKLQIEDAYRAQLGQPPLVETEFELARDPSRSKELQKIRRTYRLLTGDEAPLERLDLLRKRVKAETDPTKAAQLRRQLRALTDEYRQAIGR